MEKFDVLLKNWNEGKTLDHAGSIDLLRQYNGNRAFYTGVEVNINNPGTRSNIKNPQTYKYLL